MSIIARIALIPFFLITLSACSGVQNKEQMRSQQETAELRDLNNINGSNATVVKQVSQANFNNEVRKTKIRAKKSSKSGYGVSKKVTKELGNTLSVSSRVTYILKLKLLKKERELEKEMGME